MEKPEIPRRRRRHYYELIAGIGARLECIKLHLIRSTETPITETECVRGLLENSKELEEIALSMEAEIEVERFHRQTKEAQEEMTLPDAGSSIRA